MDTEVSSLIDYLVVLRRRKRPLLWVTGLLLVISALVALSLPAVYRSTAMILVEQKEIPEELVQSTITLYADAQIKIVSERVLTTANLQEMIRKFNLYPVEQQEGEPIEVLADRMRENIELETVSAQIFDPSSGRARIATISFTVSFEADSPQTTQKVTNELAALFLRGNVETRTEKAANTAAFLSKQAEKLKAELLEAEAKLAVFKQKNVGRLPELSDLNLRLLESTDRDLMETVRQIRALKEQQVYLEAQLVQVNPNAVLYGSDGKPILSPPERLKSLQAEFASKAAVYAPNHPDLVKMGKELAALQKQLGGAGDGEALQQQLTAKQAELAAGRDRYSEEHPDVKRLQREVAALQARLKEVSVKPPSPSLAKPDNPAYIQLQASLETVLSDLRTYGEIERQQRAKLEKYEQRLTETPQVEREYLELSRDYESTAAKYREIKQKLINARLGESLEKSSRGGERFSLIEPAWLPYAPYSPNRLAIAFAGIVFSLAGGLGAAALAEGLDQTVRGSKTVTELLQDPPLVVVPYIENRQDRRQRVVRWALVGGVIVAAMVGGAGLVHFEVVPLELVWSNLLKHLGLWQESAVG